MINRMGLMASISVLLACVSASSSAVVGTAAFGDGEAAGTTSGNERLIEIDEGYVGVKKGIVDFSVGRQAFSVGDGFILSNDGLVFGDFGGAAPELNRGGSYYLGGSSRKGFANSAILKVGKETGLRGDIFWLDSDNKAQAEAELAGVNVEYTNKAGTFGAMHLKVVDINPSGARTSGSGATELDIYAEWVAKDNLILSPVIGKYSPDIGEDSTYVQLLAIMPF